MENLLNNITEEYEVACQDVTEQKLMQEVLIRNEEKYRLMADNTTDLISVIDKNGLMVYASSSHLSVLGYCSEEIEGSLCFDLVHPNNLSDILIRFIYIFETSESVTLEYQVKHKTKGWVWIETKTSTFLDVEQEEKCLLIVSRVIEER